MHIEHQSTLWVKCFLQQTWKGSNCSCELLMSRQPHHKCNFHSLHPPTTSAGISSPWKQKQLLEHKNDSSKWNVEQKKKVSAFTKEGIVRICQKAQPSLGYLLYFFLQSFRLPITWFRGNNHHLCWIFTEFLSKSKYKCKQKQWKMHSSSPLYS